MTLGSCFFRENDDGSRSICIRVEANTPKDIAELYQMAECVHRPVETYGKLESSGAWVWFQMPCSKEMPFGTRYFGNERRKERQAAAGAP